MNVFDLIVVVVVSFCLVRGLFRGLVREVSSIVGVLAGFYGAYTYHPMVEFIFEKWVANPGYRKVLAFFILFCAILIGINILANLIRYLLNIVFLGWVDRLCGMVFGGAKGLLIVSVLFIILTTLLPKGSTIVTQSRLSPHVANISELIAVFVSRDMKNQLDLQIEGIKKSWEKQKKTIGTRA